MNINALQEYWLCVRTHAKQCQGKRHAAMGRFAMEEAKPGYSILSHLALKALTSGQTSVTTANFKAKQSISASYLYFRQ